MSSPLFNSLNGGGMPQNNMFQMVQQFQQFKKSFNGNPKDAVMGMLQSGKINQSQLNQFQSMANQLKDVLK